MVTCKGDRDRKVSVFNGLLGMAGKGVEGGRARG